MLRRREFAPVGEDPTDDEEPGPTEIRSVS